MTGALVESDGTEAGSESGDAVPGDTVPDDTVPGDTVPGDTMPGDTMPGDTVPGDAAPASSLITGSRRPRKFKPDRDVEEWHGAYVPYDLVKEFVIALVVVAVLVVGLAVVFSSP